MVISQFLKEAIAKNIEAIGIVDSNSNPTLVIYPIPMNDDATKAIEYVLELMKQAIIQGQKKTEIRKKEAVEIKDAKSKKPKTAKKTPRKKNKSLKKKKVEKK